MKGHVIVRPKNGVLDPQGKAIVHALHELGYTGVSDVRQGKSFEVEIEAASEAEARAALEELSRKLLANTVIEDYEVRLG